MILSSVYPEDLYQSGFGCCCNWGSLVEGFAGSKPCLTWKIQPHRKHGDEFVMEELELELMLISNFC